MMCRDLNMVGRSTQAGTCGSMWPNSTWSDLTKNSSLGIWYAGIFPSKRKPLGLQVEFWFFKISTINEKSLCLLKHGWCLLQKFPKWLKMGGWHDSVKGGNVARTWPYQGHIMRGLENKQGVLKISKAHIWVLLLLASIHGLDAIRCGATYGRNNTRHGCRIHSLIKWVDSHMGKQNNK